MNELVAEITSQDEQIASQDKTIRDLRFMLANLKSETLRLTNDLKNTKSKCQQYKKTLILSTPYYIAITRW